MLTILTFVFFGGAVLFLSYAKNLGTGNVPARVQTGVQVSKHAIALFVSIYGSAVIALLVSSPLLILSRLLHSEISSDLFSGLVDRPYFPLQVFVACVLGVITFQWLRDGWAKFIWVLPLIQALIAVAVFRHRFSPIQTDLAGIQETFLNWGCGCSASLPQWTVMFPLYTSIAFALGAVLRSAWSRELGFSKSEAYREFQRTKVH